MMEGTVNPVSQPCSTCGNQVVHPRMSTYTDRLSEDVITEAEWVCTNCGSRFASGIVSREKKNEG